VTAGSSSTSGSARARSRPGWPPPGPVIGWGAAKWLASPRPRDAETAWWTARYQVRLAQRISAASFVPPPGTDAARLSIRPREIVTSRSGQRLLRSLLRAAYRSPGARADTVLASGGRPPQTPPRAIRSGQPPADRRDWRRLLIRARVNPGAPVAEVTGEQWHRLAIMLSS